MTPEPGSGSVDAMARGEPGLPHTFSWRGERFGVAMVIATGKSRGEDRGGVYMRKRRYDIETTSGLRMRVYFDRNPGKSGSQLSRWWVYWVEK